MISPKNSVTSFYTRRKRCNHNYQGFLLDPFLKSRYVMSFRVSPRQGKLLLHPFHSLLSHQLFQATRFFPSRSFCRSSLRSNMPARVKNSLACMKNMLKSPCQVMRKTCGYIYIYVCIYINLILTLREKSPNTEFFLVRIFAHSDWIRRFTP